MAALVGFNPHSWGKVNVSQCVAQRAEARHSNTLLSHWTILERNLVLFPGAFPTQ